jgi:hypothetical protein
MSATPGARPYLEQSRVAIAKQYDQKLIVSPPHPPLLLRLFD